MLKNMLRGMNAGFREAGLPYPSQFLYKHGLTPYVNEAFENLGIKDYTELKYPINGSKFDIIVRNNLLWQSIQENKFESECINYLSLVIKKGMKVLDVGAGIGTYTLLFSILSGSEGTVHAFEPDQTSNRILHDNVRKNRLRNVIINDDCISNKRGVMPLKSRQWGSGNSTIMGHLDKYAPLTKYVHTTTIDDYCVDKHVIPDGIKIDVEGAEGLVLEGAKMAIETHAPWVLLEFHGGVMSSETKDHVWRLATRSAAGVIYLCGNSPTISQGAKINSMPDCDYFHVFMRY